VRQQEESNFDIYFTGVVTIDNKNISYAEVMQANTSTNNPNYYSHWQTTLRLLMEGFVSDVGGVGAASYVQTVLQEDPYSHKCSYTHSLTHSLTHTCIHTCIIVYCMCTWCCCCCYCCYCCACVSECICCCYELCCCDLCNECVCECLCCRGTNWLTHIRHVLHRQQQLTGMKIYLAYGASVSW